MSEYTPAPGNLDWHVSRTCESSACVGVARDGEFILIGNTNDPRAPVSIFTAGEWREFLAGAKLGHFDGIA